MTDQRRQADDQNYAHFVTFTCDGHRRLLDQEHPKRLILKQLNKQLREKSAKCVGFVIMPDHVHATLWLGESKALSKFIQSWKRVTSFQIRQWYREQDAHYFERAEMKHQFWIPKYYAFAIYSTEKLEEKLHYMHLNPVRAGLVERPEDWTWSSAAWYASRQDVGVPIEWIG